MKTTTLKVSASHLELIADFLIGSLGSDTYDGFSERDPVKIIALWRDQRGGYVKRRVAFGVKRTEAECNRRYHDNEAALLKKLLPHLNKLAA